jgi:hypothetical protein
MKRLFQLNLLLLFISSATAQESPKTLRDLDWKELAQRHELSGGEVISMDGTSVLKIENTNNTPLKVQLFRIQNPSISNLTYAIIGQVKYENVQGDAYLEMWNYFSPLQPGLPEGQYFSRTLGTSGEMEKITGTSDWRKFSLPFDRTGASGLPTRLEINIYLSEHGTVYLRPMKLVEYKDNNFLMSNTLSHNWWSEKQAGMIGGIGGSIIGCFGGLLGLLVGKGKARNFVLTTIKIFIALGIFLMIAGLIAIALKQPYCVWYVLLLPGILLTAIFSASRCQIQKRYDDLEIRRMTSIDAMGN